VENFEALFEAGLLVLTMPREAGGGGFGIDVARKVIEIVASGEPATALSLEMTYGHHARLPHGRWPEHIVRKLQQESLARPTLFNSTRVEPELGTPARGGLPATIAARTETGWRINGHKLYATGSPIVSYFAVWVRTEDDPPRVGYILVPRSTPGLRLVHTWNHLGLRASRSDDLILEDVEVPLDYGVDLRPVAEWGPMGAWDVAWNAFAISSVYQGVARSARNWLVQYLNERTPSNLGAPLASLPRFQAAVGQIEAKLLTNDTLLDTLGAEADSGNVEGIGVRANLMKSIVTGNAIDIVKTGLELTGNPGLSRNNPLERHYRDVLCGPVHTPQDDSVFTAAGKAALASR
jgi:alkylation response protein AidB-like acyl-CoA dehydrogenase